MQLAKTPVQAIRQLVEIQDERRESRTLIERGMPDLEATRFQIADHRLQLG
ncbi:hypothetical protein D3C79_913990 [compost metagenome]